MMRFAFILIVLHLFSSPTGACNLIERDSLMLLLANVSSPSSAPLNWSSINCCNWEGVKCDYLGRITHLKLPYRGLQGAISSSISKLVHLSHLNLSHNQLTGPFPSDIFPSLIRLMVLDLSFNYLSGTLRPSLSLGPSIRIVDLSGNDINGTIPNLMFQLASNLVSFNVSNNDFTGPIPSSVCINSSSIIKLLDFSSNDLQGLFPEGLGECSQLEVLRAGYNKFSGPLPHDLFNIKTIREISLPGNNLSGSLDGGIVQLTNLTIIDLSMNKFTGNVPEDIGKLSNLEQLFLQMNSFTGMLPQSLMNCVKLTILNLRFNLFEGNLSSFNFSKLDQLQKLDLMLNSFTGGFPTSLHLCKSLVAIRLTGNLLEGPIPPAMVSLQSLYHISLANNSFTNITSAIDILMGCKNLRFVLLSHNFFNETMPDNLSTRKSDGFKNLRGLGLGKCYLRGKVPSWIARLRKIEALDLSINQLTGLIPGWLATLKNLFYIDMGDNFLEGEFPQELCGLQKLRSEKAIDHSACAYLQLPVFVQPKKSSYLQYNSMCNYPPLLNFRNNNLRGKIPTEIGQLRQLYVLDLSNNHFSGTIPDQISHIIGLEKLNLSRNNLSGKIPESLASLNFLSTFSVSYNNLKGPIPLGTQLQSFPSATYEGNPGLCGGPINRPCVAIEDSDNSKEKLELEFPWLRVFVGLGYATGFMATCITLFFHRSWRVAYFQFLSNAADQVYVLTLVFKARFWRLFRK